MLPQVARLSKLAYNHEALPSVDQRCGFLTP
jgi:hypothetical protein